MKLTDEKAVAIDHFRNQRSLKVAAFAGSGKTSTLVEMAKSDDRAGLYLAFNKSIATEAQSRFPARVTAKTTHSVAFRAIAPDFPAEKLTGSPQANSLAIALDLAELRVDDELTLSPRSQGHLLIQTLSRFCQSDDDAIGPAHVPDGGRLLNLSKTSSAKFRKYTAELADHVWSRMTDPSDPLPMGHDGYLKLWCLGAPRLRCDYVLLDEAQDTNGAVLGVLEAQHCQRVYVGDPTSRSTNGGAPSTPWHASKPMPNPL